MQNISENSIRLLDDFGLSLDEFHRIVNFIEQQPFEDKKDVLIGTSISCYGYSTLNRLTQRFEDIKKKKSYAERIFDLFIYLQDEGKYEVQLLDNKRISIKFGTGLQNLATISQELLKMKERGVKFELDVISTNNVKSEIKIRF